jgi:hypothetical protein
MVTVVKERASAPASLPTGTNATITRFLSDALLDTIVPQVLSLQNGYFFNWSFLSIVAGQSEYDIPSRAIGKKFKTILKHVDSSAPDDVSDFAQISPASLPRVNGPAFYFRDDVVVLVPTPTDTGTSLKLGYYRRPSQLVSFVQCARVTSVDTVTNEVTCGFVPSDWTTANTVDIVKGTPSFGARGDDLAVTGVSGATLTLSSIPAGVTAGDWVCLSGTSCVPQIPYECFSALTQLGVQAFLESLTRPEQAAVAKGKADVLLSEMLTMLSPRDDAQSIKIVSESAMLGRYYG